MKLGQKEDLRNIGLKVNGFRVTVGISDVTGRFHRELNLAKFRTKIEKCKLLNLNLNLKLLSSISLRKCQR